MNLGVKKNSPPLSERGDFTKSSGGMKQSQNSQRPHVERISRIRCASRGANLRRRLSPGKNTTGTLFVFATRTMREAGTPSSTAICSTEIYPAGADMGSAFLGYFPDRICS